MKQSTTFFARVIRIGILGWIVTIIVPGCAIPTVDLVPSDAPTVERIDSKGARIGRVHIRRKAGIVEVSGELKRRRLGFSHIPGHLHIRASSQNGKLLEEATSGYGRHSAKSRRAYFSVALPVKPGEFARIEVILHAMLDDST